MYIVHVHNFKNERICNNIITCSHVNQDMSSSSSSGDKSDCFSSDTSDAGLKIAASTEAAAGIETRRLSIRWLCSLWTAAVAVGSDERGLEPPPLSSPLKGVSLKVTGFPSLLEVVVVETLMSGDACTFPIDVRVTMNCRRFGDCSSSLRRGPTRHDAKLSALFAMLLSRAPPVWLLRASRWLLEPADSPALTLESARRLTHRSLRLSLSYARTLLDSR